MNISYRKLNESAVKLYFDGRHQEEPVYLDLDNDSSNELAESLNCDLDNIEVVISRAISSTFDWTDSNPYIWHVRQFKEWNKNRGSAPPPFIGLLLGLSISAERMRQDNSYSANNYYERLFEFLEETDKTKQSKLRLSAKFTADFWNALNQWLIENDYALGIPTAKQVNSWKYVSYAISQTLVRESEKSRLRRMFLGLGISPHENLSITDATQYIHQWMVTSEPNLWLRKLWSKVELRERVAIAALQELSRLDAKDCSNVSEVQGQKFLAWILVRKKFPRNKIQIYLTSDAQFEGKAKLIEPAEYDIKREANESLVFTALPGSNLSYLGPTHTLKLDGLLTLPISVEADGIEYNLKHRPRPIVPLSRAEAGTFFKEVSRVSMFTEHALICHVQWQSQVVCFLNKYARNEFEVLTRDQGLDIPENWVLITSVYIIHNVKDNVSDNLQCLVPLALGNSIQLEGGIRLQQNVWHASAPPNVIAASSDGLLGVELQSIQFENKNQVLGHNIGSPRNSDFLRSLITLEGPHNNFILVAKKDNKVISERNISFRTANYPRKTVNLDERLLAYSFAKEEESWELTAKSISTLDSNKPYLRGMLTKNISPMEQQETPCDFESELSNIPEVVEIEETYDLNTLSGFTESCILRGYHIWECPPAITPEDFERVVRPMRCKDCDSMVLSRKPRMGFYRLNRRQKSGKPKEDLEVKGAPKFPEPVTNVNLVFDALCYLQHGTWKAIQNVCSDVFSEPWESYQFVLNLSDLGHIDIEFDSNNFRLKRWSIAPTTLVVTESNFAFLAGYRSTNLVEQLSKELNEFQRKDFQQELGPDVIGWQLGKTEGEELEYRLHKEGCRLQIPVIKASDAILAQHLPSITTMIAEMPKISLGPDEVVEKYDVKKNQWIKSQFDNSTGEGAYRGLFNGRTYFYNDENRICRAMPCELAKLSAALKGDMQIISYDEVTEELSSLVGCPPPLLYRRALVACSGQLPTKIGTKSVFRHIPKQIASIIFKKVMVKK
ncbi:hypothetical protein [Pseudidiomarina homiensis]|uniref:Uncharacterized protein n=1 Tax=Pseudidiomarina homiensis TaxID=364198 RepID=A0A432XXL6_9GAMM|nr:hypothetical protein [Pseudidiomarina homiensis]RUO53488.1 hypothetical protein CWI70_09905 [Pseudidiomarina homiensis]